MPAAVSGSAIGTFTVGVPGVPASDSPTPTSAGGSSGSDSVGRRFAWDDIPPQLRDDEVAIAVALLE